jgi:hypothetical protein
LRDVENVSLVGYGAAMVMAKQEYSDGEWRHAIQLRGSRKIVIEGVRIDSSGGDGIYVAGSKKNAYSSEIRILNCRLRDHRRQGISVISSVDLLVQNSRIEGTSGTSPQAGIDFEPNSSDNRIRECRVVNCDFSENRGLAAMIGLSKLSGKSSPVSIEFRECLFSRSDSGRLLLVAGFPKGDRAGRITFRNCVFRNPKGATFTAYGNSFGLSELAFENCEFDGRNPGENAKADSTPMFFFRRTRKLWEKESLEGVGFRDCVLRTSGRPMIGVEPGPFGRRPKIHLGSFFVGSNTEPSAPNVSFVHLALEPERNSPPPMLREVRRLPGGDSEVRLENWRGDSLGWKVDSGSWKKGSGSAWLRLKPGETLKAVAAFKGSVSDSMIWMVPGYWGILSLSPD